MRGSQVKFHPNGATPKPNHKLLQKERNLTFASNSQKLDNNNRFAPDSYQQNQ